MVIKKDESYRVIQLDMHSTRFWKPKLKYSSTGNNEIKGMLTLVYLLVMKCLKRLSCHVAARTRILEALRKNFNYIMELYCPHNVNRLKSSEQHSGCGTEPDLICKMVSSVAIWLHLFSGFCTEGH